MSELSVRGLGASYGRREVLFDLDLDLEAGEMLAVLGPSGCGKTTLLRSLAGLHRIDRGSITLAGTVLAAPPSTHVPPEHRRIGLMPQEGGLFPHLSVGENVGFGLVNSLPHKRRGDRARRRSRVEAMLELVGLPDAIDVDPRELSGGQQQRVALARALAPNPSVVLMDEPFASLDAGLRSGLRREVRELLHSSGTPSILVTHDRTEAMTTADRVTVLLDGSTAQTGTPHELYHRPSSEAVGAFVGEAMMVEGLGIGMAAETVFGTIPVTGVASGSGRVLVRPEQLTPIADSDGDFVIVETVFAGPQSLQTLEHLTSGARSTAWVRGTEICEEGERVRVKVSGPVAFFDAVGTGDCDRKKTVTQVDQPAPS